HFQDFILAVRARFAASAARNTVARYHVLPVLQVQQRPQLLVAAQDDVSTATAISPIRATLGHKLFPAEVRRTRATCPGAGAELHIINKIGTCQMCIFTVYLLLHKSSQRWPLCRL